jgi:hypothetical protein
MALLVFLEATRAWAVFRTAAMALLAVSAISLAKRLDSGSTAQFGVLVLILQPLVYFCWLVPFEDKAIYAVLVCAAMAWMAKPEWSARRRDRLGVAIVLGALGAYGGITSLPILCVLVFGWRSRWTRVQHLETSGIALLISGLSWALFYPDWKLGLVRRAMRQGLPPIHDSLWRLTAAVGLSHPLLPTIAALGIVTAALIGLVRGWSPVRAVALVNWAALSLAPNASLDRILAGSFPLFVLQVGSPGRLAMLAALLLAAGLRIGGSDVHESLTRVALAWIPILLAAWWSLRGEPPYQPLSISSRASSTATRHSANTSSSPR